MSAFAVFEAVLEPSQHTVLYSVQIIHILPSTVFFCEIWSNLTNSEPIWCKYRHHTGPSILYMHISQISDRNRIYLMSCSTEYTCTEKRCCTCSTTGTVIDNKCLIMRNSYNGKNKTGFMEIATDSSFLGWGGGGFLQHSKKGGIQ